MSETFRQGLYKSYVREVVTEKIKQSRKASCIKSAAADKEVQVGAGKKGTLSQIRDVLKYEPASNKI